MHGTQYRRVVQAQSKLMEDLSSTQAALHKALAERDEVLLRMNSFRRAVPLDIVSGEEGPATMNR